MKGGATQILCKAICRPPRHAGYKKGQKSRSPSGHSPWVNGIVYAMAHRPTPRPVVAAICCAIRSATEITHSQKDGVESNGGSLKGGAEVFMLILCGAQLVLRSSVLRVFDLEVNVTLKNAEIYGSVLSGEGGSANGWPCC